MIDSGRQALLSALFCSFFVLSSHSLNALDDDPILSGEFWVELDPFIQTEERYPLSTEDAHRRVLEEAQYVFSGVIYGFTFVYTPSDAVRQVEEIFTLEQVATIPWGDPSLSIVETRVHENLLFAHIRYFPSEHQTRWLRMMESNIHHTSSGRGGASMFLGVGGKFDAIAEATKEAIREHLRPRIYNKPKEVRGKVVFTESPYIIIDAGRYEAKVSVRIDVDEIIPYRIF